jgi:hypothetical protein
MFADLGHFSQLSIKVMNSVTVILSSVNNVISVSLIFLHLAYCETYIGSLFLHLNFTYFLTFYVN